MLKILVCELDAVVIQYQGRRQFDDEIARMCHVDRDDADKMIDWDRPRQQNERGAQIHKIGRCAGLDPCHLRVFVEYRGEIFTVRLEIVERTLRYSQSKLDRVALNPRVAPGISVEFNMPGFALGSEPLLSEQSALAGGERTEWDSFEVIGKFEVGQSTPRAASNSRTLDGRSPRRAKL
jgi:hypothetical protein